MDGTVTDTPDVTPCYTRRVGVLFLRRKRPGFDPEWGMKMDHAARTQLAASSMVTVIPDVPIVDDASLRTAVFECRQAGCEVLVVLQTTMSDGRLAPVLAQLWEAPVVLWATPEKQEGAMISACSLVGLHVWAATLRQLGRPFEIAYGMPGEPDTTASVAVAVTVAHTAERLPRSRAALVGYHAPGFIDMHADPFLMNQALGMQLHHVSLKEFIEAMGDHAESSVTEDVDRVMALGLPLQNVGREDLRTASRYYLTLKTLIEAEHLDALAVRDWPELSDGVGQWPYLAMARLSSEGVVVGCEGDVDGTISCYLAELLGCGPAYLTDWLEHDHDTITLWHAGNAPFQLCEPIGSTHGPQIGRHFNNGNPAVVNAHLEAGMPITIFRLWHCDGTYLLTACDAESIAPRRELLGTNGLARISGRDVHTWFDDLCHAGMPHHPVLVRGHHCHTFKRLARQLGLTWID